MWGFVLWKVIKRASVMKMCLEWCLWTHLLYPDWGFSREYTKKRKTSMSVMDFPVQMEASTMLKGAGRDGWITWHIRLNVSQYFSRSFPKSVGFILHVDINPLDWIHLKYPSSVAHHSPVSTVILQHLLRLTSSSGFQGKLLAAAFCHERSMVPQC